MKTVAQVIKPVKQIAGPGCLTDLGIAARDGAVLRIALVSEGVTDFVVLKSAINSMLGGQAFLINLVQPEGSLAFSGGGDAGPHGGGWKGVKAWCQQAADRAGGSWPADPVFLQHDLVVLHLDADVAGETAQEAGLPCERPCPPAPATTNGIRAIVLSWLGEQALPARAVFRTPSKSTETWVFSILLPGDASASKPGWECRAERANRLSAQTSRPNGRNSQAA